MFFGQFEESGAQWRHALHAVCLRRLIESKKQTQHLGQHLDSEWSYHIVLYASKMHLP